jgi:hypothetical protein
MVLGVDHPHVGYDGSGIDEGMTSLPRHDGHNYDYLWGDKSRPVDAETQPSKSRRIQPPMLLLPDERADHDQRRGANDGRPADD